MSRFHQLIIIYSLIIGVLLTADWWWEIPVTAYILITSLVILILFIGSASMSWNLYLKALTKGKNTEKKIAITFDDGPHERTLKLLDVLKKYNVKATFFCIGKNIEKHPDILKRIDLENHLIGNHTFSHSHFINFYGKKRLSEEIENTTLLIEKHIQKKTLIFRPPHGVTNPPLANSIRRLGLNVIGWSIRSFDTMKTFNSKLIDDLVTKIKPGSVLLLHDHIEKSDELLAGILDYALKNGYKCVGVDELFNINVYE